jgi:hypothetical protein
MPLPDAAPSGDPLPSALPNCLPFNLHVFQNGLKTKAIVQYFRTLVQTFCLASYMSKGLAGASGGGSVDAWFGCGSVPDRVAASSALASGNRGDALAATAPGEGQRHRRKGWHPTKTQQESHSLA